MKQANKNLLFLTFILIFSNCKKDDDSGSPQPIVTIAAFSMDKTTATTGETITFTNESQNANNYEWDFGDGNNSGEPNPTHSYSTVGTFDISLKAIGEGGTDSDSKTITINAAPIAAFSVSKDSFYTAEIIKFTNLSEHATSYLWDFGDNKTSTEQNPSHSFESEGLYTVTLTATGASGNVEHSLEIKVVKFFGTKALMAPNEEFEFFYSTYTSFAPNTFDVSYLGEGGNYFSHTGLDWISYIMSGSEYFSGARFHYTAAPNTPNCSFIGRFTITFKKNSNTHTIEKNVMFIIE